MADPDTTVYLECEGGRETCYRIIGRPEALEAFAATLTEDLRALPRQLDKARDLPLRGIQTDDANGSQREVYLSVRAEPSDQWLASNRAKTKRRDWVLTVLFIAVPVLAIIGLGAIVRWIVA